MFLTKDADGGVFNVESGSSLTFMVPVALEDNYVMAGYSGGAVYAGGQVRFYHQEISLCDVTRANPHIYSVSAGSYARGKVLSKLGRLLL